MWPGPYGDLGSRKHLLDSLDQSLARLRLDHVDVFYHHRFDPDTPMEETLGALDFAVRSGRRALHRDLVLLAARTSEAIAHLRAIGTPLLIHQPSYSMLNRWIEEGLLDVLGQEGVGCIAFSPLAQGMLSSRYLAGVPEGSRATQGTSLSESMLSEQNLAHIRGLNVIAAARGQTLAQMAVAWVLRDPRVTSALVGVSRLAVGGAGRRRRAPRLQRRRADPDRPGRARGRHQPVGGPEHGVDARGRAVVFTCARARTPVWATLSHVRS